MAKPLVSDELWELVEPLLPVPQPRRCRYPGRKPIGNRQALTGIIFGLKTGIPWEYLPQEMGCGSGMTCCGHLRDWQAAGVWDQVWAVLLSRLHRADKIDRSRAVVDSASLRAVGVGEKTGPNPRDRAKAGSKYHILTDAQGLPMAALLSAANENDITYLDPLRDAVPQVRGKPGHPRRRFARLTGDRGYDSEPHRQRLRAHGTRPELARRRAPHGSGLGRFPWVVERTLAWFHQFHRLRTSFERRADIHQAFLSLASILITMHFF